MSRLLKAFKIIGLILALGVSMSADAGLFGFGGTSWKEEVLLHDGSKIVVERSIERGGHHKPKSVATNETLTFTMPSTNQTIAWEDKFSDDIGSSNFNLLMLDIYEGTVYIVATPMGCLSYNKWGRPNPPYVIFKYQDNEWKRIPLQELPADIKTPNLIFSSPDDTVEKIGKSLIPAETISQIISQYPQPEYRTILREPIAGGGQGRCEPMVHYKCGWFGTNPDGTFNKEFADRMCNK